MTKDQGAHKKNTSGAIIIMFLCVGGSGLGSALHKSESFYFSGADGILRLGLDE